LPPEVVAEEAFGDLPDIVLFPDEEVVIANAVPRWRRASAATLANGSASRVTYPAIRGRCPGSCRACD
jgi:hypothetical protein